MLVATYLLVSAVQLWVRKLGRDEGRMENLFSHNARGSFYPVGEHYLAGVFRILSYPFGNTVLKKTHESVPAVSATNCGTYS
jgi:hypothetical protein